MRDSLDDFGLRISDLRLVTLREVSLLDQQNSNQQSAISNLKSQMRYGNRYQFGLTLLTGFFLLATLFAVLLYALMPTTPATRGPLLLTAFVAILLGTLVCIL